MSLAEIRTFLAWTTTINLALFVFSAIYIVFIKDKALALHSKWYGVPKAKVKEMVYLAMAIYKIFIITFNIAPYLALRLFM